jgi:hypothetical protein
MFNNKIDFNNQQKAQSLQETIDHHIRELQEITLQKLNDKAKKL